MELQELLKVLSQDEELLIRYRNKNRKVYYLGQKLLDINLNKNEVTLPETLKLSGKEYKNKKYQEYLNQIKTLSQFNTVFEVGAEKVTFEFTNAHIINFKNKLEELKDDINDDLTQNLKEYEKRTLKLKNRNTIEKVIEIQQELFKVTIGKAPFKKPDFDIKFLLKYEKVDKEVFNKVMGKLKELIRNYNLEFVGNKEEKMFQQYMMKEKYEEILKKKVMPLEVEIVFYPYLGLKNQLMPVFEKKFKQKTINKDTSFSGRIDNVYLEDSKKITFVEIKVDDKVIAIEKNGVLKHLHDMRLFYENKRALNKTFDELEDGYKIKTNNPNNGFQRESFNYNIICGYTSDEIKEKSICLIKEDVRKYKKEVIEPYKEISKWIKTKLLFVKIIKDEEGKIRTVETSEKSDYTEILEIN